VSTESRIGTEIAGYRIESLLGRGGMSVVYLAEQEFPRRKVALKLLAQDLVEDETFRERFIRESNAAASIDHPNIVPIYGAGEAGGILYIAMRYVEGTDLRSLLNREDRLEPIRAASIVSQAANALDTAHEHGLVHRDVKPGNLLMAKAGGSGSPDHVYVSDFGLIKRRETERDLTRSGQVMGSVDYIAPEQVLGKPVDGRADVYSLGCVLFECLTGEPPFSGEVDAAVMWAHVHEKPPRVTSKRSELPAGLDDVLAKAMAKSPDARYATCGELATAAREEIVGAREATPARPGRWSWRRRAGAGAVVVALAAGAFVLTRGGGEAPKVGEASAGCEVTSGAPLNDGGANQAAYEGLTLATADLGVGESVKVSNSSADWAQNIQALVDQPCLLILTVGPRMRDVTRMEAKANPDQDFAIVGATIAPPLENVLALTFRIDQAAFLAGYLAAGMSGTGKVATLGDPNLPQVTDYMNGFAAGILKYNLDHGTHIGLLGWDPATGAGAFVSKGPGLTFADQAQARHIANAFISHGADVILPVAGGVGVAPHGAAVSGGAGIGAARAAQKAGNVLLIGAGTDQFVAAPEFAELWLTSILEKIDLQVDTAMVRAFGPGFAGGVYVGTLENDGVALAPFHDLANRVPKALEDRLVALRAGIADGSISVDPKDYRA